MSARTDQIIEIAKSWIGTPYHHQASLKGVGCDCIGLVRGVYRELYGIEPPEPVNYSPDWGDTNGNEEMVKIGFKHMDPVPVEEASAGHVVLIRWREHRVAKHCMILTEPARAIHAYNRSPVSEIRLNAWWLNKIVYAFAYPEKVK